MILFLSLTCCIVVTYCLHSITEWFVQGFGGDFMRMLVGVIGFLISAPIVIVVYFIGMNVFEKVG